MTRHRHSANTAEGTKSQSLKHQDKTKISKNDLKKYIEGKMKKMRERFPGLKLSNSQLWDKKVAEMADSAQGLFIWVKTALGKFIF